MNDRALVPWEPKTEVIGKRFGRQVAMSAFKEIGTYNKYVVVRCDCGSPDRMINITALRNGTSKSCGCLHKEKVTKHGLRSHPIYRAWVSMIDRCNNPANKRYSRYGGRGITVCQEWHDVHRFVDDMSESYSEGLTIDRIDNNAGYSKENCRWATHAEQNRNCSRNIMLTHDGKTMCIADWAIHLNITYGTLWDRIKQGWSTERALTTPVG